MALLHKPNCANWYQRTGEGRNERVALAFEGCFRLIPVTDAAAYERPLRRLADIQVSSCRLTSAPHSAVDPALSVRVASTAPAKQQRIDCFREIRTHFLWAGAFTGRRVKTPCVRRTIDGKMYY